MTSGSFKRGDNRGDNRDIEFEEVGIEACCQLHKPTFIVFKKNNLFLNIL